MGISFLRRLATSTVYYLLLFPVLYFTLLFFGLIEEFSIDKLKYYDAENYWLIAQDGYAESWLTAFFPLFPRLWSLGFSFIEISFLNAVIFIFCISYITWKWKVSRFIHITFLALPSILFFFLPYSESLFFLFAALLLLGLSKRSVVLVLSATFLAALTRPTISVFIPAFWLLSLVEYRLGQKKFDWKTPLYGSIGSILGLFAVFWVQSMYTGEWFTFFESQKLWGNELRIPSLPFSSWGGNNIVKLDALATLVGLSAGVFIVWSFFFKRKVAGINREVIFSLLYLAGTALLILLVRGGEFFSLNRFIFSTPFFLIVLHWVYESVQWKRWYLLPIAFFVIALLFGAYVHIQALLKWLIMAGILAIWVFILMSKKQGRSLIVRNAMLLLLVLIQAYFFWRFLNSDWIG